MDCWRVVSVFCSILNHFRWHRGSNWCTSAGGGLFSQTLRPRVSQRLSMGTRSEKRFDQSMRVTCCSWRRLVTTWEWRCPVRALPFVRWYAGLTWFRAPRSRVCTGNQSDCTGYGREGFCYARESLNTITDPPPYWSRCWKQVSMKRSPGHLQARPRPYRKTSGNTLVCPERQNPSHPVVWQLSWLIFSPGATPELVLGPVLTICLFGVGLFEHY